MHRRALPALAVVSCLSFSAIAAEQERPRNVRVDVTIVNENATGEATPRTFELLTLEDRSTELLAGWRVPILTGNDLSTQTTSKTQPVRAVVYQNIGVTIRIQTAVGDDGRVHLDGQVEMSDVQDSTGGRPEQPTIGTFQHAFDAMLTDGTPLTVSRAPRLDGGSIAIVVEAVVLE